MSHKFERICNVENLTIVRCDSPKEVGALGTSQVIGPYSTVYSSTAYHTAFLCSVNDVENNDFSKCTVPPAVPRTSLRDNTGNRYSVHSFSGHNGPIYRAKFLDQMVVATVSEVRKYFGVHTLFESYCFFVEISQVGSDFKTVEYAHY